MECKHPMQFWALYRALALGPSLWGFRYRCPSCRRKLKLRNRTRFLYRMLCGIGAGISCALGIGISYALGLRGGRDLFVTFFLSLLFSLCLLLPVCRVGLRHNYFEILEY